LVDGSLITPGSLYIYGSARRRGLALETRFARSLRLALL